MRGYGVNNKTNLSKYLTGGRAQNKSMKQVLGLVLAILLSLPFVFSWGKAEDAGPPRPDQDLLEVDLERVVDGDTLIVWHEGQRKRLRLIGLDAPESVSDNPDRITPEGKAASRYLKKLMADYTGPIYLEFDQEAVDQYERLLAYVWLGDKQLNYQLCRQGWARARTYPPNTHYDVELAKAMALAQEEGLGIWQK